MSHLRHYLWIAVAVSTLATVASDPVLAKPLVRAKTIVASQPTATSTDPNRGSRQPIAAILAKVRLKAGQTSARPLVTAKVVVRTAKKTTSHINANRSSQGTTTFTSSTAVRNRANNSSALDRWLD